MQLIDKVILITGGASGIGRATAFACAREGASLIIADIDTTGGQETVQQITSQGSDAFFIETDVTQAESVQAMVNKAVAYYGRIDAAFNNAGIEGDPVRTADVTEADFDRIMAVNLKGVWLCMKYEIKQMLTQNRGVIVNTASVAGLVGSHSLPAYGASKHGVVGLTKTAAVEYARKDIRVNAICPAVIQTPMMERSLTTLPDFAAATIRANPSRRFGQPEEVAAAVVWLCSDAASFVNGATLTIDGGYVAQ